jgi:hypothetical protein
VTLIDSISSQSDLLATDAEVILGEEVELAAVRLTICPDHGVSM